MPWIAVDYERYRVPLVLIACAQAFFASGIFYGWASLYTMFLETGVYSNLCINGENICQAQKDALQMIYTIGSATNLASQLPWGMVLDRCGPRICSTISSSCVMAGFVLLAAATPKDTTMYMMAVVLIGGAGPGVQISLFHLSELFPTRKSTVLSIVTGAFQLGFCIFLIFRTISSYYSIPLTHIAMAYCIPLATLVLMGMAIWPDRPLIAEDDDDPVRFSASTTPITTPKRSDSFLIVSGKSQTRRLSRANSTPIIEGVQVSPLTTAMTPHKTHISPEMTSLPSTHAHVTSQSLMALHMPAPITTPARIETSAEIQSTTETTTTETYPLLKSLQKNSSAQKQYGTNGNNGIPTRISTPSRIMYQDIEEINPNLKSTTAQKGFWSQFFSPSFFSVLIWMSICLFWANYYVGTVVEQLYEKSHHDPTTTRFYTDMFNLMLPIGVLGIPIFGWITDHFGFTWSILATSLLGSTFALCNLSPSLPLQICTFIAYSFFRTFLFSVMFSYLANEFGYRFFGLLSGIVLGVGSLLSFLQYPLHHLDTTPDSSWTGELQFITLSCTCIFALYTWWKQKQRVTRLVKSRSSILNVKYQGEEEQTSLRNGE